MTFFQRFSQSASKRGINVLTVVLSLLLAFGLWLYVVSTESPTAERTFDEIKVQISGVETLEESHGFTVLSGYDYSVSVTLRGRRSVLNALSSEQVVAKVDVSDITEAGDVEKKIKIYPPSGTELVSSSSEILAMNVDRVKTVSVPVLDPQATYTLSADVHVAYKASPETLSVTGPELVVGKIHGAHCVLNLGENPVGKVTQSAEFSLVDEHGNVIESPYLRIADNRKVIVFEYSFYKEKEVPLKVDYTPALNGERVETNVNPSTVTVKGAADQIDQLEEIVVHTVNTKDLGVGLNTFEKSTYSLPDGLINAETGTSSVSYDFTATLRGSTDQSVFVMSTAGNVAVRLPENLKVASADRMEVVFRTTGWVSSGMYTVELNLSDVTSPGTYDITPKVTVKNEYANTCYVKNVGVIQVTLSAK